METLAVKGHGLSGHGFFLLGGKDCRLRLDMGGFVRICIFSPKYSLYQGHTHYFPKEQVKKSIIKLWQESEFSYSWLKGGCGCQL